ncbi:Transferase [Corchorus olitorius]|uniref:Transferase n=1 Tax=Corchorus olitorius TaxID=93759 RepID=A0A1R3G8T2_9ROSI|nr:Transferase [Corchorus olitorius]
MVFPAQDTPKRSLWLSNLDLVQLRYHVPTIYFYKPNGNSSNFFEPKVLKDSLSEILVPFYPIAGRLQYDETGKLEIISNGKGVLFLEAETTSIIDDLIGNFTDSSRVPKLVPTVDYSGGISSYPLLALQVTTFKCGGVSLGVALEHTLTDGPSALHFINSWAEMVRGLPLKIAPCHDRTLLKARVPPTPTFHHVEFQTFPRLKDSLPTNPKPSTVSVFKITVNQLYTLKSKISENSEQHYSTYSILTAHIWRCAIKARGLADDQEVKLLMPIDGRRRLDPPLPLGYFGNVIFTATPFVQVGVLETEQLLDTVRRIDETLKQFNDEYLRSALDYMEVVGAENVVFGPETMGCPNLSINSWIWLPIHEADFGWGRPVYMRPANVVQEGKFYILPSPINDGSLSVVTRLETLAMESFGKLLYEF